MRPPEKIAIRWQYPEFVAEQNSSSAFLFKKFSHRLVKAVNDEGLLPREQTSRIAGNYLSEWQTIPPNDYPPAANNDIFLNSQENSEQQNKITDVTHTSIEDILGRKFLSPVFENAFDIFSETEHEEDQANLERFAQSLEKECMKRTDRIVAVFTLYSPFLNTISDPETKKDAWNMLQKIIFSGEEFDEFFAFLSAPQNDDEIPEEISATETENSLPVQPSEKKRESAGDFTEEKEGTSSILPFQKKQKIKLKNPMSSTEILRAIQENGVYGFLAFTSLVKQQEHLGEVFDETMTKSEIQEEMGLMPNEYLGDKPGDVQMALEDKNTMYICRNSCGQANAYTNEAEILRRTLDYIGITNGADREHARNIMMKIAQKSPEEIVHILFHVNPKTETANSESCTVAA